MSANAKPLRQRQDELLDEIFEILIPYIDWKRSINPIQQERLRTAIAQYTLKIKEQE